MIVNHQYKFIFVRTRKVASTSIEIALSRYCNSNDILTPLGSGGKRRIELGYQSYCNCTGIGQHESAQTLHKKLKNVWDKYFKFSVIRDPTEYLISDYYWCIASDPFWQTQETSFEKFVNWSIANNRNNWYIHTIDNVPAMDFYVRYEHLQEDLNFVSKNLCLPGLLGNEVMQFNAKSEHRKDRTPTISKNLKEKINQAYKHELDLFNMLRSR